MKIGLSSRLLRKWSNVGSQSLWWLGELGRPGAWWMRNGPRTRKRSEWLRMWTAQGRGALSPTPPLKPAETRPVDQAAGSSSGKLSNRLQEGGGAPRRSHPLNAKNQTRQYLQPGGGAAVWAGQKVRLAVSLPFCGGWLCRVSCPWDEREEACQLVAALSLRRLWARKSKEQKQKTKMKLEFSGLTMCDVGHLTLLWYSLQFYSKRNPLDELLFTFLKVSLQ